MKPFRYRLQLLKDLRERDRDEALQSYGVALRKRINQQETSDSIEQRIEGIGQAIQTEDNSVSLPQCIHSIILL